MLCPHCGQTIKQEAKFCAHCGKKITPNQTPPVEVSTEEKEKKIASNEDNQKKVALRWKPLIVFGVIVLVLLYYFFKPSPPSPPPPTQTKLVPTKTEVFFTALREAIYEAGIAKSYYKLAQKIGVSDEPVSPTPSPTATPNPSKFFRMAENYARAIEYFSHAKQIMENIKNSLESDEKECKEGFIQNLDKYIMATGIFNENSKALYQGNAKKVRKNFVTDAQAKYEMADQLMSKFLMEGCKGAFFKFVSSRNDLEKRSAFIAYEKFFSENFGPNRKIIEMSLNFQAPPESLPSEIIPQVR